MVDSFPTTIHNRKQRPLSYKTAVYTCFYTLDFSFNPIRWSFSSLRLKIAARIASDIYILLCHTLKIALGTAAKGEKFAVAIATLNPEFCIPTSMATAFCLAKSMPSRRGRLKSKATGRIPLNKFARQPLGYLLHVRPSRQWQSAVLSQSFLTPC